MVLGIPVAVYGMVLSLLVAGLALAWWRRRDRRALLGAYLLLLPATAAVAYLTDLELFVIHAICAWCVAYAVTILAALGVAALALRRG